MASFNEFEGIPVTANKYLLDDVLRKQWGFNGFVVTDYTGTMELTNHGIGNEVEVTARALKAGIDMDMVSEYFSQHLEEALEKVSLNWLISIRLAGVCWKLNIS